LAYLSGMKTTIELPDDLLQALRIRAAEEGRSMKALLTEALRSYFGKQPKAKKPRILKYHEMPIIKDGKPAKQGEEITPERVAEVLWGSKE